MREIKFRGKALMSIEELDQKGIDHNNGWVYGNLIVQGVDYYIVGGVEYIVDDCLHHSWWLKVQPETVGQYTGLKDVNGVEIYEGDIVEQITTINWYLCHGVVIFEQGKFLVNVKKADFSSEGFKSDFDLKIREYTVIGNIHDNPELLSDTK